MTTTLEKNAVFTASTQPEYAIEATGLRKAYGPLLAVDGFNLKVKRGEIYGLLGPNGAGKTTIFNILVTLTRPDEGHALVAGFDVVKAADQVRERIGVTFQESGLDKQLSGRNLLDIHRRLYGLAKADLKERTLELARLLELEEALDRPIRTYSGGMKRRLELARCLVSRPDVLFLDEPTVGLDPPNREWFWAYLQTLCKEEELTILFTTHYMDEAEKLADRVGIIDRGKLVAENQPAALLAEMGLEVVRVSGSGPTERFSRALQEQPWVAYVNCGEVKTAPALAGRRIHLYQAATQSQQGTTGLLQIGLRQEAGRALKPIIELAEQHAFTIFDLAIDRPGLHDVFLKYTGRRLDG